MKLASKFALAVILIMAAVFGVRGYQGVERQIAATETNIREDQFIIGRALRPALTEVWRSEGPQRALEVLAFADERIRRSRSVQIRWVPLEPTLTENQRRRIHDLNLDHIRKDSDATVVRTEGDRLVTYVPVMIDGKIEGAIQISEALTSYQKEIRDDVRAVVRRSAIGALMSILAITALGFAIVGRPVRRLVEKARRIGAGDLEGPLAIRQRDEIGELAREMNQMCDRLRTAQQRIGEETEARIAALEQLRHADRLTTVGTLASGIAHELGTPLSVVSGHTTMIATGEVVGPDAQESARIATDQVHRITRIIRQLLDFARRRSPERGRYALDTVIVEALTLLRPMAQKRGVELRVTTGSASIDADVDPTQIQQAVTNLVLNGIQATSNGGQMEISLSAETAVRPADPDGGPSEFACIDVRDQGVGIPPNQLDRIFEPFFTTKGVGEGTGLGLSVAYGIARDHGGWISVESVLGKGSQFSLYIPLPSSGAIAS